MIIWNSTSEPKELHGKRNLHQQQRMESIGHERNPRSVGFNGHFLNAQLVGLVGGKNDTISIVRKTDRYVGNGSNCKKIEFGSKVCFSCWLLVGDSWVPDEIVLGIKEFDRKSTSILGRLSIQLLVGLSPFNGQGNHNYLGVKSKPLMRCNCSNFFKNL